jgi:hypothetical protein
MLSIFIVSILLLGCHNELSVIMLSVIMPSVIMPSVTMLSVTAPSPH